MSPVVGSLIYFNVTLALFGAMVLVGARATEAERVPTAGKVFFSIIWPVYPMIAVIAPAFILKAYFFRWLRQWEIRPLWLYACAYWGLTLFFYVSLARHFL